MRLLFDHNLSPRLVDRLADVFPNSLHVYNLGLAEAEDVDIWNYAKINHLTIVTRDSDYSDIQAVKSFPPKILWIRRGNCSTNEIESLLRECLFAIQKLSTDSKLGVLTLF